MAKLTGKLEILVDNDDQVSNNPQKRIQDSKVVLEDSTISQWQSKLLNIADAVVDQAIGFDGISAEFLFILSDQQISIKLNGSSDPITLYPGFPFVMKGDITSLLISNSSGSSAEIEIGLGK